MTIGDPETLLHQTSPFGSVDAIVEQDERVAHFYLQGSGQFGTRACWVANLQTGPLEFNLDDLGGARPPMLPRVHCRDPRPAAPLASDDLQVVWFEAGDGAALLHREQVVAVLPPWSGQQGFHGYAANCAAENRLCWPLLAQELLPRIDEARAFWRRWIEAPPFREWQPRALSMLEARFGKQQQYWAIDGGNFPPRGLAAFLKEGRWTLVTLGMSLVPQPLLFAGDPPSNWHPWIELGMSVPADCEGELLQELVLRISSLAAMPWREQVWLGAGHTCDLLSGRAGYESARVLADDPTQWPTSGSGLTSAWPESIAGTPDGAGPRILWLV